MQKIEIETFNLEKVHNIWSTIGAKYLPSVVYKLRMIVVDSNSISNFAPAVQKAPEISNNGSNGKTTTAPVKTEAKDKTLNTLEEIDKALEESGLSTDTSKLNDPSTLSQVNNLKNIK
jgi:hypothetical protein